MINSSLDKYILYDIFEVQCDGAIKLPLLRQGGARSNGGESHGKKTTLES